MAPSVWLILVREGSNWVMAPSVWLVLLREDSNWVMAPSPWLILVREGTYWDKSGHAGSPWPYLPPPPRRNPATWQIWCTPSLTECGRCHEAWSYLGVMVSPRLGPPLSPNPIISPCGIQPRVLGIYPGGPATQTKPAGIIRHGPSVPLQAGKLQHCQFDQ